MSPLVNFKIGPRCLAVLAAVGALTLTATASAGATATCKPWTISPGGNITATSSKITLTDTASGIPLTCTSSHASGTLMSGSWLPGTGLGSITTLSFNKCTDPISLTFSVASNALPWSLNARYYGSGSGVTHGTLTGIGITITGINSSCDATADGTAAGADNGRVNITYTNSTGKLKILPTGGNLHIYNVSDCPSGINSGDATSLAGTYKVTPAQTITSP
jgi:hypothetical protein